MTAEIIDGVAMSKAILDEVGAETAALKKNFAITPGLATILVGDNPASISYVSRKAKTARSLGFNEIQETLPADTTEEELLEIIRRHNASPATHGILVQLPLPAHINEKRILQAINPDKDVDGFHPVNMGRLLAGDPAAMRPCTPAGILEMLFRSHVDLNGAEALVIGRSNIVGKPVAILLAQKETGANATVTIAHTGTKNLEAHCRRADVLIAAAGRPGLVRAEWLKPGVCVIDVGVNRVGFNEKTGKAILRGDVDFESASRVAGKITPVPGGAGPMTIAMLMKNTLKAATMLAATLS